MAICKTSGLIGPALDWAVAKCELAGGHLTEDADDHRTPLLQHNHVFCSHNTGVTALGKEAGAPEYRRGFSSGEWHPSTDWSQGGPIIEREKIALKENGYGHWFVKVPGGKWVGSSTPLIAAMRCYVASKLGDEIEIPDELFSPLPSLIGNVT